MVEDINFLNLPHTAVLQQIDPDLFTYFEPRKCRFSPFRSDLRVKLLELVPIFIVTMRLEINIDVETFFDSDFASLFKGCYGLRFASFEDNAP